MGIHADRCAVEVDPHLTNRQRWRRLQPAAGRGERVRNGVRSAAAGGTLRGEWAVRLAAAGDRASGRKPAEETAT
jgi:hypothetical protein